MNEMLRKLNQSFRDLLTEDFSEDLDWNAIRSEWDELLENMALFLSNIEELDECNEDYRHFVRKLSYSAFGQMMLQLPITLTPGDPDTKPNAAVAQPIALILGPDWCQAWYHFAVMMTKLERSFPNDR